VPVGVHCHLNGAVTHLFLYVWKAGARFNQSGAEKVSAVVEPKSAKASVFNNRQEISLNQIVRIKHLALRRRKDELVYDTVVPSTEGLQQSLIPKLE
jgi:hypothetical protein